jgi:TRAP-type C4-dicarboxylate transport system substrate-binding protein
VKVDKAPFRAAVQPLFDEFKKDPKQAALLAKFEALLNNIYQGQSLALIHLDN